MTDSWLDESARQIWCGAMLSVAGLDGQDELFQVLRLMATVKLIVLLLYLGHIFGCIFYFFSDEDWLTP